MTRIEADWITTPATQAVCAAIAQGGARALFVGGCVRNTLLGVPVSDIDIATDAVPETVLALARSAGIKALATGIEHGTVTLVCDGLAHEVTTFRRDVATDGWRAVVAFSDDVAEDAARRDFTMNALYARPDGSVIDPLGGMDDLRARRVRFIGDARDRIREDHLRSLRYFRFHAWYGDPDQGFDLDALSAISRNLEGLAQLSRERIGAEMLKLLAAPDPAPSLAAMRSTGALAQFLPGGDDRALAPLIYLESVAEVRADALRRLAVLGGIDVETALRLSRADRKRLDQMRAAASGLMEPAELGYRLGLRGAVDALLLRAAWGGQPWQSAQEKTAKIGANAHFPVTAQDLMPRYTGAALGEKLALLERDWIASSFALDRETLLARV